MKVPLEWLKAYVAIRLAPEALAERLTMAGLEVTGIEQGPSGPVFDLEITPNRADCLSIIGVAREVAAITGQRLKPTSAQGSGLRAQGKGRKPPAPSPQPTTSLSIHIDDQRDCMRYIGRLIENVTIKPSPQWMQRRLLACGARPINNLVDITNYVLLEYGQPLHAFDADRLSRQIIRVRRATTNEPITTLDGVARTLRPDTLVIADAKQPIAVAGVMGAVGSEVAERTTRVLLESALFDPVTVRRTARTLGLASESSYRFERGVDPEGIERASLRAAELILELAGGCEVAIKDVGAAKTTRVSITLEPSQVQRWLGMPVEPSTMRTTLARLGCRVMSAGTSGPLRVTPPSYRRDLTTEVDLYEELARLIGYDRVPASMPTASLSSRAVESSSAFASLQSLRQLCAGLGLTEVITWSLVSEPELLRCKWPAAGTVRLVNPLSQDHAILRPSLLMGLLQVVRRNVTRGTTNVPIFEVGHVVLDGKEQSRLGIMLCGDWFVDWTAPRQPCSFWVIKGLLEAVTDQALEMAVAHPPWADRNESASIMLTGRVIGTAGKVSPSILEGYDLKHPVWFGEVFIDALPAVKRSSPSVKPPAEFPPVKRDLSVLIDEKTPYAEVNRIIREAAGALADRIELIDRFTGKPVPPGRHSLTFSLEYRNPSRTLTAEEADAVHQRVTQTLIDRLGAVRR